MKPPKRVRRGELWCGGRGINTGEPDACVGTSMDAGRFEASALRNDDGDSLGVVGALDGAEEGR